MITQGIMPGDVQAGDLVHLDGGCIGLSCCPGDELRQVVTAPAGKSYIAVRRLGVTRWVNRNQIRSAIRRAPEEPSLKLGPILDIPI